MGRDIDADSRSVQWSHEVEADHFSFPILVAVERSEIALGSLWFNTPPPHSKS